MQRAWLGLAIVKAQHRICTNWKQMVVVVVVVDVEEEEKEKQPAAGEVQPVVGAQHLP